MMITRNWRSPTGERPNSPPDKDELIPMILQTATKNGDGGERPFGVQFTPLPDGNHRLRLVPPDAGPFVTAAPAYWLTGWLGALPLPARQKNPPPTGYTGHRAPLPTGDQIDVWLTDPARLTANIGIRLAEIDGPHEILGIDVDHYADDPAKAKFGGDQLDVLQDKLGELPDTWTSSARSDGVSGIRFFRVPTGLRWNGQADKDIEIVSRGYRFAVVWPSIHPSGDVYTWYEPGNPPDGASTWSFDGDGLPKAADLPELPQPWIDHLTTGRADDDVHDIDNDSSVDELRAWAIATFNDGDADSMCARVSKSVEEQCERITAEATSHDKIVNAHYHLYRLAAEGHTGWRAAIETVEAAYRDDVIARDKRGRSEVRDELFRSGTNALRKVKTQVAKNLAIGAVAVPPECTCEPVALLHRLDIGTNAGQNRPPRNTPLDLKRLRTEPTKPVDWLLPGVVARDSYVSLSAAPGTGKSILSRAIAVDASLGRSATDPSERFDSVRVVYLDAENGEGWWRDGLNDMTAPLDLPNLAVVCYPEVAGLDTAKGAREFHALIDDIERDRLDGVVDLVVLDTVSRFIAGGENDADTWSQFYRLAIQPLRDRKVAVLRLDHLGKDADRGPRGSSHKLSDVDADFRLTTLRPGSDDLVLTLGKRRRHYFTQTMNLRRLDGPLRHEPATNVLALSLRTASGALVPADDDVSELVAELDRLGVASTLGRDGARTAHQAAGGMIQAKNAVWAAAVKFRKTRLEQGGQQP